MEAQILPFLLFIVPAFLLFYFMTEVYMRSRMNVMHRLAAVIMADMIIWFMGEYARALLPIRYAYWIEAAFPDRT